MPLKYFPYPEFREGQEEFAEFLGEEIESHHEVMMEAPTGFGKTILTLSVLLPMAKSEGRKIVWLTRTGNEADRPIEELGLVAKKAGERIFGLSFRGKRDMCSLLRELKGRGDLEYEDVSYFCEKKRKSDECPYYERLKQLSNGHELIVPRVPMRYSEVMDHSRKEEICPYYYQYWLADQADVVSLSYNYVLSERIREAVKLDLADQYLVVDEAHNVPRATEDLYTDVVTMEGLGKARDEAIGLDRYKESGSVKETVVRIMKYLGGMGIGLSEDHLQTDFADLLEETDIDNEIIDRMLLLGKIVWRERSEAGKKPSSSLHHLAKFISESKKLLGMDGITFWLGRSEKGLRFERVDFGAFRRLRGLWKNFHRCIFMSGTLRPEEAYAELLGLDDYSYGAFHWSVNRDNVLTILTKDLSTRGKKIDREMIRRYGNVMSSFLSKYKGNAIVFSASYRVQEELLPYLNLNCRSVFAEDRHMPGRRARKILDDFKKSEGAVLFASAGGRFSEGVDLPGKELEGVFLVGVPFGKFASKTKARIEYYKKLYGSMRGRFYSYVLPAITRASQALGRALRSEEDKALFVLGDRRYRMYLRLFPDYIISNLYELDSDSEQFLELIKGFDGSR